MMNISVNNQVQEVSDQITLKTLLATINLAEAKGIALAVNNQVIPKTNWENYKLKSNDKITIIRATQGG